MFRSEAVLPAVAAGSAFFLAAGAALAGEPAPTAPANDPLEPLNRGLFAVHRVIDKVVLRPAALIYRAVTPEPLRDGLHNAVQNLGEPVTFVNDLLEVRPNAAMRAFTRFATNSTVGLGGMIDVAGKNGVEYHYSDFGETLARYGVPSGPYLFIPVLGPSTLRDAGGLAVDTTIDPTRQVRFKGDNAFQISRAVIAGLDLRLEFDDELQELDRSATDPYVTLRSAYIQNRATAIRGGTVDVDALPSFTPEPSAPPRPRSEADPNPDVTPVSETLPRSPQ